MLPLDRYKMLPRMRCGFAILTLLVVIAIILLLYFIDMKAIFGPNLPTKSSPKDQRPWLKEDLILKPDQFIKLPQPPKPTIEEDFSIIAPVTFNGENRGEVTIDFNAHGEVSASWYCRYSLENRDYTCEANFTGNIHTDTETEDPTQLYFITKGNYTQTVYNHQSKQTSQDKGLAYTTGPLAPDYSAAGMITITTDKTWSATYNFNTKE